MKAQRFLGGRVTVRAGDCLKVLAQLPDNCVDAIVTDPPYHLTSIVRRFGATGAAPAKAGKSGAFKRASAGFMGKQWDGGDIAFRPATWATMLRVLKPGGYLLAFASSRGFGRMSVAIEDAGFITHPMIGWLFGSGFPKATQIDAPGYKDWRYGGQALKPALEPIYMGQKPFSEDNGTDNILLWGTGAINIEACRVPTDEALRSGAGKLWSHLRYGGKDQPNYLPVEASTLGRWPANLIHDGSEEVLASLPSEAGAAAPVFSRNADKFRNTYGDFKGNVDEHASTFRGDSGSAARFFYCAKASAEDRLGFKHPTIKPLELKQYLVRLVTPPGGLVLDPFAGTGTTGEAAFREGFRALLIEREPEYLANIALRMELADNPAKRAAVVATAGADLHGAEGTPLFSTPSEAAE